MWLRLLFLPFLFCGAQWVFPSTSSTPSKPDKNVNNWVNNVLGATSTPSTTTPFDLNVQMSPTLTCTTKDNKDGKCVKPQFCGTELEAKDTTTLFDYRGTACHYLLQCCALSQVKQTPKKQRKLPGGCGWTNPGGYSLRSSDSDNTGFSDYADFPWMVALLKKSHNKAWTAEDYIGGGTLIHPSVVLTVAHKVESRTPQELKCRAGEWDTQSENEIYLHQDRDVNKISIHDDFLMLRAYYDAALLFLDTPFKLKDVNHIGVACLMRDMPAPGTLCYSMGWGTSFNTATYATLLKKIQLPIVDPQTCQQQLRNTRLGSNFLLHHTLACAGGEAGRDTCIGDGGSPLICPIASNSALKRYAVYGMVAYGVGCGQQDVPGVYAKVPVMLDWINREMEGEQLETTGYYN